jgi:hypothetical protein
MVVFLLCKMKKPLVDTVGPNGSSAEADPLIPTGSSGKSRILRESDTGNLS